MTFVGLAKILRYSAKPLHCNIMNELFEVLIDKIDTLNNFACLHASLMGTNLQNCNQKFIEKILFKMNANIDQLRLKDLDRMSLVVSLYDFESESGIEIEFMKNVQQQLRVRVDEIVKHARCYTTTLYYLSTKGIYDEELIGAGLKENFLQFAFGNDTN